MAIVPPYKIFGRLGNQLFQYAYIYAQAQRGEIPDIYLQDPVHFQEYRDEIRALFRPSGDTIDQVAIHVRRGDYVNNPFYVDLYLTDYYERAMDMFPDCEFLVFSDDIEWCKQQPIFSECEFAHGTELEDLDLMSSCKGIIMANSSFSWWASYLSTDGTKIVCPSVNTLWYSDNIVRTNIPSEWIQIEK